MKIRTAKRTLGKLSTLFCAILISGSLSGQVINPFGNATYLGLGYGVGSTSCTSTLDQPNLHNDKGDFYCKASSFAMTFAISHLMGQDKTGIHLGYYAGFTLGGSSTKWYLINPNNLDRSKNWQTDFDLLADMRLGLQVAYYMEEKSMLAGVRYYNCYAADGLRSSYGNADDAAVIGLFYADDRFGVDLNLASGKTPGILVKSDLWGYLQCDVRVKIATIDRGETGIYGGLRFEHSWMTQDKSFLNLDGHQNATVNSVLATFGMTGFIRSKHKKHKAEEKR